LLLWTHYRLRGLQYPTLEPEKKVGLSWYFVHLIVDWHD
jgi:hypothetical protein